MPARRTLWLLYAVFIIYGGTIPFHFATDRAAILERARHVRLNPFVSPDTGQRLHVPDIVQNVLLFVPFGALGMLGAWPGRYGRRFVGVTALGLALSTAVEAAQLLTVDRVASATDILANTAGTMAGAAALLWFRGAAAAGLRSLRAAGLADVAELRPLAISAAVIAIAWWQPFDVTLEVGVTVSKVRALQADVWQFTGLRDEGTSIILAVFFATTLASYLSTLGEKRPGVKAGVLGACVVCALEGSQLLIGSRMPSLWDAAVGVTGVVIGTGIWAASARVIWPRLWLAVIVAATLGAAALQMLSPFELAPAYRTFGWFPFFGYYSHTSFETLSHIVELTLLYFPLGFWLGAGGGTRRRALTVALLLTLFVAAPIEYLQGWIVGRYPDVSDVAVSLLGALAGVMIGFDKTVSVADFPSNSRHIG